MSFGTSPLYSQKTSYSEGKALHLENFLMILNANRTLFLTERKWNGFQSRAEFLVCMFYGQHMRNRGMIRRSIWQPQISFPQFQILDNFRYNTQEGTTACHSDRSPGALTATKPHSPGDTQGTVQHPSSLISVSPTDGCGDGRSEPLSASSGTGAPL